MIRRVKRYNIVFLLFVDGYFYFFVNEVSLRDF